MKERLIASSRLRGEDLDPEEDRDLAPHRVAAGKTTSADARKYPALLAQARPGKLNADAVDNALSPEQALRYSDWLLSGTRVHRRAEVDLPAGDDVGALSQAFSFLEESRGGTSLPAPLLAQLSAELGADLSRVRIHADPRAAAAAAALQAQAFTIGNDIYFASGAYEPDSDAGVQLIAHEVAHVAQTQRGTASSSRPVSRRDDAHERDAEAFARRFRRTTFTARDRDPAAVVDKLRREGNKAGLPFMTELEQHFGTSLDFVDVYTGQAAQIACQALSASAFAIHNIIAVADPSPRRDQLLHELTHVMQMGKQRAPGAFRPGSLGVSDPHSAAEVEARQGTGHQAHAPDTQVHRDPDPAATTPSDTSSEAIKKRFAWYAAQKSPPANLVTYPRKDPTNAGTDKQEELVYRFESEDGHKYTSASDDTFRRENYLSAMRNAPADIKRADATMAGDISTIAASSTDSQAFGLSRVNDKVGVYVFLGESWKATVVDNGSAARKAANPVDSFKAYFAAYLKLKDTYKRLNDTNFVLGKDVTAANCTYEPAQADAYRRAMTDATAAAYVALGNDAWDKFYTEVMVGQVFPPPYQRIQGNIFEKIVHDSVGAGLRGDQPIFRKPGKLSKDPRLGDDAKFVPGGAIVIDAKAVEGDVDKKQAEDYNYITEPDEKIRGYFKGEDAATAGKQYKAVGYAVAGGKQPADPSKPTGPTRATRVSEQLGKIFVKDGKPDTDRFYVSPDPDGMRTWILSFNPQVRLRSADTSRSTYTFANPPTLLPGVSFKTVSLDVGEPGGLDIKSGNVVMGIDMAGAFTASDIAKPIPAGGQVENKFGNFKSKLDQLLGPFTADAKLTDGGVQATIALKQGAAKIPGFKLDGASLTATLTGDSALSVTGQVGLTHNSGKISGTVTVTWAGGQWSFDGKAILADGLVEGLSGVELGIKYEKGETTLYCASARYTRAFKAVTLTGMVSDLSYNVTKESFSGSAEIEADLGMFGKAHAIGKLENNKLKSAELHYDSPELKYPAKSDKPAFTGTIGGTVNYDDGKFSGSVKGTAKLNVPALQKIAGDSGLGLAVDATIAADGSYSGSIRTTSPLKFGKYFQIDSVGLKINPDGSVEGDFAIAIKNIKHLENASIGCRVDSTGFHVISANVHASFGAPTDKMWGSLDVGYAEATGLAITGTLNVKIKEGMIATGSLTYNSQTNDIDVSLTVQEITLFDLSKKQSLFKFSKQIPLVSFYSIIGIYLDLGLDLDFDFSMKLGLKPTITLDGLSFDTWEYKKIAAIIELTGQLRAALTATPKLGLGLFAISPSLLRGGGGLKMPITAEALLTPKATLSVGYSPSGGVEGDATIGMQLTFGIKGAVQPYAEAAVLDGMWNPNWTGDALTEFEILPPKELFNFTLDLAGDMKPKEPQIPTSPQAPTAPSAARQLPQDAPKTNQVGDNGPGRDNVPPTAAPAGGAADDSMFKMSSLMGALKGLPGYQTISGFMDKAAKVWDQIKGFFGRVVKAFKNFFAGIEAQLEEVLNGFATQGLAYLPKLIQKIVGPDVWDVIEPIINAAAGSAEQILQLFETAPPANAADFFPWALKLMQKAFGIGFDSIPALINALRVMMGRLAGLAVKIVNQMVHQGMIGVKRHQYYYWAFGDHYFLAADEYKINMLGINIYFRESGMLLNPNDLVGAGLFDVLEQMGVPPTNMTVDDKTHDTYRDRWV
jgi:hypothetical protein